MKRHWTNDSLEDFQFALAYDYVDQLQDALEEIDMKQSKFATIAGTSESRVSQLLGNPGNLTLKSMVRWARAIGRKISVVFYDDGDVANAEGPIDSEVFLRCWELAGKPRDLATLEESSFFDLGEDKDTESCLKPVGQVAASGLTGPSRSCVRI